MNVTRLSRIGRYAQADRTYDDKPDAQDLHGGEGLPKE
jgi:hypothetical protein